MATTTCFSSQDVWIYLDAISLVLLFAWAVTNAHDKNNAGYSTTASQDSAVTDASIHNAQSKAVLAFTAPLLSIGLLRYVSINDGIGHYVLMVIAMVQELR